MLAATGYSYFMVQAILLNKNFCDIPASKDILYTEEFKVSNSRVIENNYYVEGELIAKLEHQGNRRREINLKMPFNGQIISSNIKQGRKFFKNDILFTAEKIDQFSNYEPDIITQNLSKLNDISISIIKDDFSSDFGVKFECIAGEKTEYFKLYSENSISEYSFFGLTFASSNGIPYIEFAIMSSDFQLRKDDTVILLFNDNSKLTYKFSKNRTGQKYMYSNSELLTKESIIIFATKKLKKIKITNANRNLFDVYHLQRSFFNSQYHNEISGQYLVWLMTKKFIEIHKDNNIQLPSS